MSIIRMSAVQTETGLKGNTSVYEQVRRGLLTEPVSIGQRSVGWPLHEVKAVVAARIAGKTEEEIRALVQRLHAKRIEVADEVLQ